MVDGIKGVGVGVEVAAGDGVGAGEEPSGGVVPADSHEGQAGAEHAGGGAPGACVPAVAVDASGVDEALDGLGGAVLGVVGPRADGGRGLAA